jgi:GNAT superfamily N-acetyltransferase
MDPVVRRATNSDALELDRLQALAREALEPVRGGALRLAECPAVTDWPSLISEVDSAVFVGTLLDSVVSYLALDVSRSKNRGIVTHAFVEPGARELGLGDAMLEAAIAVVRDAGLAGIEAIALPGDRETKNMYERAGLTARKLTVYKALHVDV